MIILKNDFYSSFAGACKSGDGSLVKNITINQLSDLVAYDEKSVISLMNKVGVGIAPDASDKEIVKALVENLKHNEKLRRGIAYLVADNNDLLNLKKTKGSNGKKEKVQKKAMVGVIDNIFHGFSNVTGGINTDEDKKSLEDELNNSVENKVKTSGINKPNNNKKSTAKKNNFHWWLLGGIAVVVGGVIIYGYIKKRNAAKLLASGGTTGAPPIIPPNGNPPTQAPVVTAPVQTQQAPVVNTAPVVTAPIQTAQPVV
jgi:hypothetical protein